jgi:hypothetical protein
MLRHRVRMMMAGLLIESGDLTPGEAAERIRTHFARRRAELSGKGDALAILEHEIGVMSDWIERQRASQDPMRAGFWTSVHADLYRRQKAA